jgi:hypothetical protein
MKRRVHLCMFFQKMKTEKYEKFYANGFENLSQVENNLRKIWKKGM